MKSRPLTPSQMVQAPCSQSQPEMSQGTVPHLREGKWDFSLALIWSQAPVRGRKNPQHPGNLSSLPFLQFRSALASLQYPNPQNFQTKTGPLRSLSCPANKAGTRARLPEQHWRQGQKRVIKINNILMRYIKKTKLTQKKKKFTVNKMSTF